MFFTTKGLYDRTEVDWQVIEIETLAKTKPNRECVYVHDIALNPSTS